jgi:quercetin dioxygenase-like cupin family protein
VIKPLVVLALCISAFAQQGSQQKQPREIFRNKHLIASTLELAPGEATPMHRHDRDVLAVFISGSQMKETGADKSGKAEKTAGQKIVSAMHIPGFGGSDKVEPGAVDFHKGGITHTIENTGKESLRATVIEFTDPVGKQRSADQKSTKYCNPDDNKICVSEKYLFCTQKFCVEDVTMDAGAMTTRHSHSTDHMLVAVTDYELTDVAVGKAKVVRTRKSGEVEYIPSGINHQLTNSSKSPERFIVIIFK